VGLLEKVDDGIRGHCHARNPLDFLGGGVKSRLPHHRHVVIEELDDEILTLLDHFSLQPGHCVSPFDV
jgi:hypothetical protein